MWLALQSNTPVPAPFSSVIATVFARGAESGRPIRAFGEMVALLAAAGDYAAAVRLEALWNGLRRVHPFLLVCT